MKIGIDLDGVLYDTLNYILTRAEIYDLEINGGGIVDPDHIQVKHRYNWNEKYYHEFLDTYLLEIEKTAPLMAYAKEIFQKLKDDGHELISITARGLVDENEIELTKKILERDGIKFDKIFFAVPKKLEVCKAENVDVMIDDYFKTIDDISENGIKCLYFCDLVNRKCKHENVTEVQNWGEIYKNIKKIAQK